MEYVLETSALTKRYRGFTALDSRVTFFPSTGAILPIKYSAVSEISSRRRISGGSSMEKTARR